MEINKAAQAASSGAPTAVQLEAINNLAKAHLTAQQVYVFSLRLCDDQVDRDFERFDSAALPGLAKLFIGKTGIVDHKWSSGVISRAAELETQKAPSYIPFIVPDRSETVKKLTPSFSIKKFRRFLPAGAAQVKFLFSQDFAAQNALWREQHAQQPVNQSHSVFPCKRSFNPV